MYVCSINYMYVYMYILLQFWCRPERLIAMVSWLIAHCSEMHGPDSEVFIGYELSSMSNYICKL